MGVGAGLEVHVEGAASGALAGLGERFLFGVRLTRGSVVALTRKVTFAIEHNGAHHRVWARAEVGLLGELEGAGRPEKVSAAILQGTWLSCHCNNRIRSMRFSSLLSRAGSNLCSLRLLLSDLKSEL